MCFLLMCTLKDIGFSDVKIPLFEGCIARYSVCVCVFFISPIRIIYVYIARSVDICLAIYGLIHILVENYGLIWGGPLALKDDL